jgi:hypothetical protein
MGLAYTVGGRSFFYGGWSPRLLDGKITQWPAHVLTALKRKCFDEAAKQIGTDASNGFMHGKVHVALRKLLAADIKNHKLRHTIPLAQSPLH